MTPFAFFELTPVTWACVAGVEAGLLLHAALHDIAARTIPHATCLALAAIGLLQRSRDHHLVMAITAAAGVFAACAVLWRLRWLGGGDVKLIAASCCLVAPGDVPALLVGIAISGGLLACGYLLAMRWLGGAGGMRAQARRAHIRCGHDRRAHDQGGHDRGGLVARIARLEAWRIRRRGALPYGVAISAGTLLHIFGGSAA